MNENANNLIYDRRILEDKFLLPDSRQQKHLTTLKDNEASHSHYTAAASKF